MVIYTVDNPDWEDGIVTDSVWSKADYAEARVNYIKKTDKFSYPIINEHIVDDFERNPIK